MAATARVALAAAIAAAVRGVLVLGVSAPSSHIRPISSSGAGRPLAEGVAETENKAKKKLVSHNNGDFNVTRA